MRQHWREAEAFVLAARPPCLDIRDDEVRHVDRLLHAGNLEAFQAWNRPQIWLLAVLVCRGDETGRLARTVAKDDARHVHFYLHEDAGWDALEGWHEAGLPLDHVDEGIRDWKDLHRRLGADLNVRILEAALEQRSKR